MSFDEEELDPHGECAAEIKRLQAEVASKSEQIGKLYKVCNEKTVLLNALARKAEPNLYSQDELDAVFKLETEICCGGVSHILRERTLPWLSQRPRLILDSVEQNEGR